MKVILWRLNCSLQCVLFISLWDPNELYPGITMHLSKISRILLILVILQKTLSILFVFFQNFHQEVISNYISDYWCKNVGNIDIISFFNTNIMSLCIYVLLNIYVLQWLLKKKLLSHVFMITFFFPVVNRI